MTPYAKRLLQEGIEEGIFEVVPLGYVALVEKALTHAKARKLAELVYRLAKEDVRVVLDRFNCPMWVIDTDA